MTNITEQKLQSFETSELRSEKCNSLTKTKEITIKSLVIRSSIASLTLWFIICSLFEGIYLEGLIIILVSIIVIGYFNGILISKILNKIVGRDNTSNPVILNNNLSALYKFNSVVSITAFFTYWTILKILQLLILGKFLLNPLDYIFLMCYGLSSGAILTIYDLIKNKPQTKNKALAP